MQINQEKCVKCGNCIPYCPVGAIKRSNSIVQIDLEYCVECGVCGRVDVCPVDAFYQQKMEWPRTIRSVYSDPLNIHEETDLAGRGTEEIKTNDVTNRFKKNEAGIALEVGRPGIAAKMTEVETLTSVLKKEGIKFEPLNPLTDLIDKETGKLPKEILEERVLSAIIEFAIPIEKLIDTLEIIKETTSDMETVVSVDVASVVNKDGSVETLKILDKEDIFYRPNAKINVGLGKLLSEQEEK